jgi:arylsulfate sulfotransferase
MHGECRALSFVAGPVFSPAANAPLAGVLQVETDVPTRLNVTINDGERVRTISFFDYTTVHSEPCFGFKPGRTNMITVAVFDRERNSLQAAGAATFVTPQLPGAFPTLKLHASDPGAMEPGYTLFIVNVAGPAPKLFAVIVDNAGEVVWYNSPAASFDIRRLPDGNLFFPGSTNFAEMNLLGEYVRNWAAPVLPLDQHDGVPTDHGTILYLADAVETVTNFPASTSDASAFIKSAPVLYQDIVEMSASNEGVVGTWSPIKHLDPRRITYLFNVTSTDNPDGSGAALSGWDVEHSNAVIEDPADNSLIVSMRNQNAVVKISRDTGRLIWILGPHENWGPDFTPFLLNPVGETFAWQYAQHAPVITPRGTLLVYDDGNFRAEPYGTNVAVADPENFSRAVEYAIDPVTMQVSQVWQYGSATPGEWFYTGYMGNAEPEPVTGNVLIDFSAVSYADGLPATPQGGGSVSARLREVTHDAVPRVVFDLEVAAFPSASSPDTSATIYRAHRIPYLYAHPATPVADLLLSSLNDSAVLQFSGDDTFGYAVQSSNDLAAWTTLGVASESETQPGEFFFVDTRAPGGPTRFYRVLTAGK